MPTLADTLRKSRNQSLVRGPGGALSEESTEEIQNLAGQAGLPAPPTTALGAAAIGATPKQQDMMGSPAQKQAALNISAQAPGSTIQDALRRREVRSQATDVEAAQQEKSENLKQLGGLGDRVNDFINAQRKKLEQQQVQVQAADQAQTVQGQQADMSKLKPLLQQLQADPTNMQIQLEVNKALGYDINKQLSPDEINNLYKSATDSIVAGGAEAIDNDLNVDDLVQMEQFGYSKDQLAGLLNVPVEQLGSMSVGQIRNQVNQLMADEFSQTANLEQQAGSTTAGAAERALARQGAREASRVGTRSTEADVQNLEQQISNAEQVQFGGQSYKVDDLLRDDTISGIVSNYLNAAPGSPTRTQLEQSEPGLIQFIQKNQALLQDAAEKLSGGAQQFQNLQQDNRQTATMGGLLSNELAADLVPGFNELSAQNIDPNTVPVLAATQGMGENQKRQYAQNLQGIANEFPAVSGEMKTLTADEIRNLQLDSPSGKWSQFVDQQRKYQDIMQTPDGDIESLISKVYNVGGNADFAGDLKRNAALTALGITKPNSSLELIDSNRDGVPDSASEIKSRLVSGQPSLRDALNGEKKVSDPADYQSTPEAPIFDKNTLDRVVKGDKEAVQASLAKRLSGIASDGRIDAQELSDAYSRSFSTLSDTTLMGQQRELEFLLKKGNIDDQARNTISTLLDRNRIAITDKLLGSSENKAAQYDKILDKIYDNSKTGQGKKTNLTNPSYLRAQFPAVIKDIDSRIAQLQKAASKDSFFNSGPLKERIAELQKVRAGMEKTMRKAVSHAVKNSPNYVDVDQGYFLSIFD